MSKHARRYPPEYKAKAVRLAQQREKFIQRIAEDLGIAHQALRGWIAQAQIDAGRGGLTTEEREELRRLRRENRVLRKEQGILKEATASFAQETNRTRERFTNS